MSGLIFGQVLTAAQWNAYLNTVDVSFGDVFTAAQWNALLANVPGGTAFIAPGASIVPSGTGPPYPRPGAPGSNAIGQFIIGVSPIGTIAAFDVWATIISQYANSPILTQLIVNFFQYVDQTADFDSFYDLIWNVDTAQGYGLDVWGRIVGVSRILQVPGSDVYLGFEEATEPNFVGFNQASFYSGAPVTNNFALSDTAYRTLIFTKALANISDGSIASINQLLLNLFPDRGNCYVTDGLDMTMTYTFDFELTAVEDAIVAQSGALPKPVGVKATVVAP